MPGFLLHLIFWPNKALLCVGLTWKIKKAKLWSTKLTIGGELIIMASHFKKFVKKFLFYRTHQTISRNFLRNCCVFWPVFGFCVHPKAGWNTLFQLFSTFFVHFKSFSVYLCKQHPKAGQNTQHTMVQQSARTFKLYFRNYGFTYS